MKALLALTALTAAAAIAADIPIREVILYKSGVGYFAREGTLAAGESARLDFKASNMDDVLKSLTVTDKNGGKITGLHYDASQPLDQKLADFPFQLGDRVSLAALFDQMRGARVEIRLGNDTVAGVVVSGRVVPASEKSPEMEQAVLLLDSGDLRTVDLASASAIRFADAKLQAQLKEYLTVLNQSRSRDLRSIYIDSADSKARQIDASYMIPMPVWKSSYRLIFTDKGDPTLEGWAIIDNTTGEDWSNVRLAVVSGRPVSFISKLYEPKFVPRLTVDLPEDRAANPVLYGGAVGGGGARAANMPPPAPPAAKAMDAARGRTLGSLQMQPSAGLVMNEAMEAQRDAISSVAMSVAGEDLGELFEYRFGTPVTIKKDESAMLPFLQQAIGARKLLIYSESYGEHPMSAAELTNSTGKTLDGGPITVFEGASYSGEALMSTLKAADKRLISYAVDLGTRITTKFDSSNNLVREIHANRGVLTARIAEDETKTYTIRNVDPRPKTLIIEQVKRPDYNLLDQKPSETTSNAYRFEVKLAADGSQTFPVHEERVYDTTTTVSSMTPDTLLSYVQNKALSEAGRRALQQILDQKAKIADLDNQIRQADSDINATTSDETRLRQNIQSLNQVSGQQDQVQNYARQLAAKEAQLAALRDHQSDLKKQQAAQQAALNTMIQNLSF